MNEQLKNLEDWLIIHVQNSSGLTLEQAAHPVREYGAAKYAEGMRAALAPPPERGGEDG